MSASCFQSDASFFLTPVIPRSNGRRVTQVVRDFLHAQKVQPPVELFVDWLAVGHVDEFLSFVPAPDGKVRMWGCISDSS